MKQPKKSIFRLKHVLEAIQKIESLTNPSSLPDFLNNWVIQDAVVRNIEIIGEALKSIDANFQNNHPEIPWAQAKGMRNLLAHEYFRVDMNEIWNTVQESLPELKNRVSFLLEELKSDEGTSE